MSEKVKYLLIGAVIGVIFGSQIRSLPVLNRIPSA